MKTVLTVRMDPELKSQLGKLAKATDRTSSYLVAEAVKEYLDVQAWQIEAIKEGLRQVAAGKVIPHEKVRARWEKRRARRVV